MPYPRQSLHDRVRSIAHDLIVDVTRETEYAAARRMVIGVARLDKALLSRAFGWPLDRKIRAIDADESRASGWKIISLEVTSANASCTLLD